MNTTNTKKTLSLALKTSLAVAIAALLPVAYGCDDGKASAKAGAGQKAEKDEHGHSHAEGEGHGKEEGEEGHAHSHGEHEDEVKLSPASVKGNGVRVGTAKSQVLSATLAAPARVAFNTEQMAHVGSAVIGRVAEIRVKTGDSVKKGDVLLVVDSPELGEAQSDFLQKRTAEAVAARSIELSRSSYDRAKALFDKNQGTSLNEVQKREAEYRTAEGAAMTAKAAATSAGNKLQLLGMTPDEVAELGKSGTLNAKYVIRSPIDAQVTEREVTLGELVSPDKEALLTLANLQTVWVLADVPEARLGEIANGAKVAIELSGNSGQTADGTVVYITPQLDESTRTARVRIEVQNPDARLRPGMFARTQISLAAAGGEAVVAVPEDAVQTVEGEPAVFVPVKGEPNTFAKREVGVGPAVNGMVPVFAGLADGDKFVVSGSFILKAELGKAGAAHEH